jgi:hypothetical protein
MRQLSPTVIARSASDEAIQTVSAERFWIASLTLAMTEATSDEHQPRVSFRGDAQHRARNLAQQPKDSGSVLRTVRNDEK